MGADVVPRQHDLLTNRYIGGHIVDVDVGNQRGAEPRGGLASKHGTLEHDRVENGSGRAAEWARWLGRTDIKSFGANHQGRRGSRGEAATQRLSLELVTQRGCHGYDAIVLAVDRHLQQVGGTDESSHEHGVRVMVDVGR